MDRQYISDRNLSRLGDDRLDEDAADRPRGCREDWYDDDRRYEED